MSLAPSSLGPLRDIYVHGLRSPKSSAGWTAPAFGPPSHLMLESVNQIRDPAFQPLRPNSSHLVEATPRLHKAFGRDAAPCQGLAAVEQRQAQLKLWPPDVCHTPLPNGHPQACEGSGLKESLCLPALR